MSPTRLVALVCAAQVLAQIGAYTWPALLPTFIANWRITNGEAGWITGLFYAAYTVSVPVLVTLTDRVDQNDMSFANNFPYLAGPRAGQEPSFANAYSIWMHWVVR